MKAILVSTALALAALAGPAAAQSADVTVTLTGVEARGGDLSVALAGPNTFMRGQPEHTTRVPGNQAGSVTVTLHDVAAGDWVLMVMHDEDSDGELDMSGYLPAEGYAFSNSDGPLMGMPSFDQFKVTVVGDTTITAPMVYP